MSQPIIGISGNHYKTGDHTEPLLSYTQTCLVNAIEDAGGIPLILPVTRPELAEQYMKLVDKLVLTGGQNVEPIHYQEKLLIDSSNYFPERDRFELALIEAAHHQEKPIFGICRGMQLFNVAKGGSLHQEVLGHWQENTGNQPSQDLYFPPETPHTAKPKPHATTYSKSTFLLTDYRYFYSALIVMQNKISNQYEIQFKFRSCGDVILPAQSTILFTRFPPQQSK